MNCRWIDLRLLLIPLLLIAVPASSTEVPGRVVLELTPEGARALRSGRLDPPRPVGSSTGAPRLRPLFQARTGRLSRFAILTFSPDRGFTGNPNRVWIEAALADPRVVAASSDRLLPVSSLPDDPLLLGDGLLDPQLHLVNPGGLSLNASRAWPFVPADAGVVVAIIDSGVDWNHPDLGPEVLWKNTAEENGEAGVDDDANGFIDDIVGWDFVDVDSVEAMIGGSLGQDGPVESEDAFDADNDPSDVAGHGTHVAGFVTASSGNGTGIAGAAPNARIQSLRVGWRSVGGRAVVFMSYCAQAVEYAARNGAKVINCSWQSADVFGLGAAIDAAIDEFDVVVVASAGNEGSQNPPFAYLARRADVVSVGSINVDGGRAPGSNYGSWVTLSAFGIGMPSLTTGSFLPGFPTDPDYGTAFGGGTSFSAPQVAGLAALVRGVHPDADAAAVRSLLAASGRDLAPFDSIDGSRLGGLPDFAAAVRSAGGGWDEAVTAVGLTPVGNTDNGLAFFETETLRVWNADTAGTAPGWDNGIPGPAVPTSLPAAGSGTSPLVVWRAGDKVYGARDGIQAPGWPVTVPGNGAPVIAFDPVTGNEPVFVPGGDSVHVITSTPTGLVQSSLPLPVSSVVVGQMDLDPELEVAGIGASGLHVFDPDSSGHVLWNVPGVAEVPPPVLGEIDGPGVGQLVVTRPDPTQPLTRQEILLICDPADIFTVTLEAAPLRSLSLAGFAGRTRIEIVAVDEQGDLDVIAGSGLVRSVAAGGPVAGDVLCGDVDGDGEEDLIAVREDGTVLAWDQDLQGLSGFPRNFPWGVNEPPVLIDRGGERYLALADTASGLWSLPLGSVVRPAPWPATRGNAGRSASLLVDRATPVRGAASLHWTWGANGTGELCWRANQVPEGSGVRIRVEETGQTWPLEREQTGCADLTTLNPGETAVLEVLGRSGSWEVWGSLRIPPRPGLLVRAPAPNPSRGEVELSWTGAVGPVSVEIYNLAGRRVAAWERLSPAGPLRWPGTDDRGTSVASGVYFIRITDGVTRTVTRVLRLP